MARMNLKKIKGREIAKDAGKMAIVAGAMLASRKFLSIRTFAKNLPADSWWIKNEGIVKVGVAAVLMPLVKNPMLKLALLGVGVEGGIAAIRSFTISKETGESPFPPIGNRAGNDYYAQEYNKMMGGGVGQFPGYGYTPGQVQEQMQASVSGYNSGGTAPYSGVPFAVAGAF